MRSCCGGGGARRCAAGAEPVRGNGATPARERASAEQQWRAREREQMSKKMYARRRNPRPSPVAYMGSGGGEWDPVVAVWPGVAEPTGRPIGRPAQRIPAREARRATWGPSPAVMSNRAWVVGASALTAPRKNRKRRATWVGQNGGQGNRWREIRSY